MKTVARSLMSANTALFFFGGVQHAGVAVGRFHETAIKIGIMRRGKQCVRCVWQQKGVVER